MGLLTNKKGGGAARSKEDVRCGSCSLAGIVHSPRSAFEYGKLTSLSRGYTMSIAAKLNFVVNA